MRQLHKEQTETVMVASKEKITDYVHSTVCGGSQTVLMAGQYLFDKELAVSCHVYTASESNHAIPEGLFGSSLVTTCSHSGTTPEAVEATKKARESGAVTICLSNEEGSPPWEVAGHPVHCDWGKDVGVSGLNKGTLYDLLSNILLVSDNSKKWGTCLNEFDKLSNLTIAEKNKFGITAKERGKNQKRDKIIYTTGSDTNHGEIYSTAACRFMEIQWVSSNAIHSGGFFHGPFEITGYDIPFILMRSIGGTGFLDQRVEDFTKKFSNELVVLSQAGFDLESIDSVAKEYTAAVLSGVAVHQMVEVIVFGRGHSLDARRYIWQMKY